MLDRLIDFAVHRRAFALMLSLSFAVFGVWTFKRLKIEAFPDVTNVQVMVISLYPGQAAEEVERKVTIPVERALTGTPRVLVERSITSSMVRMWPTGNPSLAMRNCSVTAGMAARGSPRVRATQKSG